VAFSSDCTSQEVREVLKSAAKLNRWSGVSLTDRNGSLLAINASIPANSPSSPYILNEEPGSQEMEVFQSVLTKVGDEFSKAFKMREFQEDISERLRKVEGRLQMEGMKAVEIDQCKLELKQLKCLLASDQPRSHHQQQKPPRKRGVPPYPKYILTAETEEYLKKPTFDIWHWEPNEMVSLMEHMYQDLGLVAHFHMNPVTLRQWLLEIQENYRDNPFHNFRHCFSVTQMMYGMIHLCHLQDNLTPLDLAILMTSAICHDLDHPGYSNSYQINARTELAFRYNDISPLENHHCAVAFQILDKPETNIFAYVSSEDFKKIRKGMIDLILATDMSRHSALMNQWTAILDSGFDYGKEDHRNMLKMMVLKCCDISNEVRPAEVAEPWLDCLLEEYFQQSDREKLEGLPVAPFMDRDKVTKSSAQIGFIRFVLLPLFESMSRLFPQLEEATISPLRQSLEHYERIKETEDLTLLRRKEVGRHYNHYDVIQNDAVYTGCGLIVS
jgi:high affinity cGMP-specific 3',5'-cyclic phosphodiesterase 9